MKTPAQLDAEIAESLARTSSESDERIRKAAKPRAELVSVARNAAEALFTGRKIIPESLVTKARSRAFRAIQQYDQLAGTASHPYVAYAHGIAELAAEGVEEARQRHEMSTALLKTLKQPRNRFQRSRG